MGRDMLSRLIYGARTALFISLIALGTGAFVGTVLGLVAGFKTGWVDHLIMRTSDAALGIPHHPGGDDHRYDSGGWDREHHPGGGSHGLGPVRPDDPR